MPNPTLNDLRPGLVGWTRRGLATCALAVLTCLAAATGARALTAPPAGEPSARELIDQAVVEVVTVLKSSDLPDDQKRAAVEAVVGRETDIETVSALVLAKHYRRFSDEQKAEFAEHFRTHLVLTYWKNAAHLLFERIDVTGDREESRGDWSVMTEVIAPSGSDVKIEYRMRKDASGRFRIIDIIIEGVSMVSNFRSQFQEVLSNNGDPDDLIVLLRDKNAASEKELAAAARAAAAAKSEG